jgi:hypothetical protein
VDEQLPREARRSGQRRMVSFHSRRRPEARVLVIAEDRNVCLGIEDTLATSIEVRSVRGATDTEGVGIEVVVLGGSFPLAELVEVRAHPHLFDKPIVLFAPGKDLPAMDWRSMKVSPVLTTDDPTGTLIGRVRELLMTGWPAPPRFGSEDPVPAPREGSHRRR